MSHDSFYWQKSWRAFRAAYLARHPMCAVPQCNRKATHLDHKIRRPIGPDFPDDSGLDGLCAEHHNRKSAGHDKPRRSGTYQHELPGCTTTGAPLDTNHPWNKESNFAGID